MTKTQKTTTTTTTTTSNNTQTTSNNIKARYIPKLIINGQVVATQAKQVSTRIKDVEVTLNCTYITESELEKAYFSNFTTSANGRNIEIIYAKIDNRVSATVYINEVLAFSSLSMQAVFSVLHTAYGISKNTLNNLYVKSNTLRKQASKSVNNIVINSDFEF